MIDGQEVWKRCKCVETRKLKRLIKASEITEEFRKLTFGNFKVEDKEEIVIQAFECAKSYFCEYPKIKSTRKNSIALLGQPGAGKTHLLTALSNNLIVKKKQHVVYFPYVEGFDDLRNDFDQLEEKMTHMRNADVLFIDDLFKPVRDSKGKRKPKYSEWILEKLYNVINHRYLNHKPLLISSELLIDDMLAIDEALATRIYEMCRDFIVIIQGDPLKLNHRVEGLEL
jgi:DNA replication protein DnaC